MKHYLIEYESSRWAGASSHCVAIANSAEEAQEIAEPYMQDDMAELYWTEDKELAEEQGAEAIEDYAFSVIGVEEFDESHEYWKYFKDRVQSQFFPLVNAKD